MRFVIPRITIETGHLNLGLSVIWPPASLATNELTITLPMFTEQVMHGMACIVGCFIDGEFVGGNTP